MAVYKNRASQKIPVFAVDATGVPKTGDAANITARISLDGAAVGQTNDVNPTELDATYAKGVYLFDLTQAESNADLVVVAPVSSTSGVVLRPVIVYTEPEIRSSTVSDKTGFSLSATGADMILKSSTFIQAIVAAVNEFATYGLTALNTLLVTTGIKAASIPAVTGATLAASQHVIVDSGTVTTLTNAPGDSSGVTEILTRLPDATAGAAGGLAIVGSKVDLVDAPNATAITAINAAIKALLPGLALTTGTVLTSGGVNTASAFYTDLPGGDGFWVGAGILILTGALAGQVKEIGVFADANGVVTLLGGTALTATPADGVTFLIINR